MTAQAATARQEEAYNEVPYQSFCYSHTHPASMHTIATLFNLAPPDFRTARVLEIGCAGGGNLLPPALLYPKASFVGIDISQAQIDDANRQKEELGVTNVEFRQQDIMTFDLKKEKGKYDYIVCHGILSWVPEMVRERIFEICRETLSPKGLALISYNALPGWNAVRSLREMMIYHTNRFTNPAEKITQARSLLDFLVENTPEGSHRAVIENERNLLKTVNDTYLFHDHLEVENTQYYLNDFVKLANKHDLDYVGDTELSAMFIGNLPPKAIEALKAVNDIVAQEQYIDFITNRRFRTSIICRKGKQPIRRDLRGEQIMDYYLTTRMKGPGEEVAEQPGTFAFHSTSGGRLTASDPISIALFNEIAVTGPRPVAAKDIVAATAEKHKLDPAAVRQNLIVNGLQLVLRGYISLHSDTPNPVMTVSNKPLVWPLARHEARVSTAKYVHNLILSRVETNEVANVLIQHMDGTRTTKDLVDVLVKSISEGKLKASKKDKPVTDGNEIRADLTKSVEDMLPKLAAQYLLIG